MLRWDYCKYLLNHYVAKAADSKADIVIFPSQYFNASQCIENGVMINNGITWTMKYNLAIVLTCNNTNDPNLINNAVLIDQNGKIL